MKFRQIGIFSTARTPNAEFLQNGIRRLEAQNIRVSYDTPEGPALRTMAGSDDERIRSFHRLLADPGNEALIAACGGYGTARLLDRIDWEEVRTRNLPVIGYSDITALHLAALSRGCRRHIQGPMICNQWGNPKFQNDFQANMASLQNCLDGGENLLPEWHGCSGLKDGETVGQIIPANLSSLLSLAGTDYLPSLTGAILVVEDTHEAAHRIDRMLNQLRQMHILSALGGLIFGRFSDCEDSEYLPEILQEYAGLIHGPAAWNLQFGHEPLSLSLPVGKEVTFTVKDGAVSLKLTRKELYQPKVFSGSAIRMPYRLLTPEQTGTGVRYPLVLLLHGAGERGTDNLKQLVHVAEIFTRPENRKKYPCFVCAPQCRENYQWVTSPWSTDVHVMPVQISQDLAAVMELLDELCRDYPVDPDRIYVTGLSMGGFAAWDLICRYPERFAAAVPMCGGADLACAPLLKDMPIWAFHGDADGVVRPSLSRNMVEAIRKAGGSQIRYTEYPGVGHNCWTPAGNEPALLPWLFGNQGTGNGEQ